MNFFKVLPKLELHAHLNGSLSNRTLKELRQLKYGNETLEDDDGFYKIVRDDDQSLEECFKKFKYAHDLTDCKETLKLATKSVIKEFVDDNVIYLEIRTTPRKTAHMTKKEYLTTVLEGIRECQDTLPSIIVKLLPSIDRSKGVKEAEENVDIVLELLHRDIVKGIDLSGNPGGTKFSDFTSVLAKARANGLKLALHCGETEDDEEIREMIDFGVDRIGHGTFIRGDNLARLMKHKIPIECCLSSNVKCGTVKSYEDHHFQRLFHSDYPVCICTDDYGVFDTSLSNEFKICSETFHLDNRKMLKLSEDTIEYSFADEDEKKLMRKMVQDFKIQNGE